MFSIGFVWGLYEIEYIWRWGLFLYYFNKYFYYTKNIYFFIKKMLNAPSLDNNFFYYVNCLVTFNPIPKNKNPI